MREDGRPLLPSLRSGTLRLLAREVAADAAFPEAQGGRLERKGKPHIPIHLMCSGNILNVPLSSRKAFEPWCLREYGREAVLAANMGVEEQNIVIKGRHDPAIVHRAAVVADAVTALVLCDMLAQRYGTDWPGAEQGL